MFLDVRSAREFRAGHVPGALHVPFWRLLLPGGARDVPRDTPLVVYCGHGPRAWMAVAALKARGYASLALLAGHMQAWRRAGKPLDRA